jgi:TolA-binding protein
MADTYTKADVKDAHDKDIPITKAWTEDKSEGFTIRDLESRIANLDKQIETLTKQKTDYQAMITEAEKVIAG